MTATWSSPSRGSSKKKKRRTHSTKASPQQRKYRSEHRSPSPYANATMSREFWGDRSLMEPRADSRDDMNSRRARSKHMRKDRESERDKERDKSRSRSPRRERNIYRPIYNKPQKPSVREEPKGSSSPHISLSGSPVAQHPDRAATINKDHPKQPAPRFKAATEPQSKDVAEPQPKAVEALNIAEKSILSVNYAEAVKALSETFTKLTEEAADVSALRSQEKAARKRYDDRQSEFNKSRDQHKKFPSTEHYQTNAKLQAEKSYKGVKDQLDKKNAILKSLAVEAAETLIPSIIGLIGDGEGNKVQEELQERFDSLEKRLEDQKKFVEDLRKANKELKEKQKRLESDEKTRHTQYDKEIQLQIREASASVHNLKREMNTITDNTSQLQSNIGRIPTDLKQRLDTMDMLSSRLNDLPGLRLGFDQFKQEFNDKIKSVSEQTEKLRERLNKIDDIVSGHTGLKDSVDQLAKKNLDLFHDLEEKVNNNDCSAEKALKSIEEELKRLDSSSQDFGTKKDIACLRDDLKRVDEKCQNMTKSKSQESHHVSNNDSLVPLQSRIALVESSLAPLAKKVQFFEEERGSYFRSDAVDQLANTIKADIGADVDAVDRRVKSVESKQAMAKQIPDNFEQRMKVNESSIERVTKLEERIVKLEKQTRLAQTPRASPAPSTPSVNPHSVPADLSSKLDTLTQSLQACRADIDGIKTGQEGLDDSMAELVSSLIQDSTKDFGPSLADIKAKLSGYDSKLETLTDLPLKMEQLQETQQNNIRVLNAKIDDAKNTLASASAGKAVEIIRAEPGLLPDPKVEERLVSSLAAVQNSLNHEMVANQNHLTNLEARMNNINTGALATYMTDQILERFPNLDSTEATMSGFRSNLEAVQTATDQISKGFEDVQHTIKAHETQLQALEIQGPVTSKFLRDIRKEVDELARDARTTNTLFKKHKEALESLEEQCRMMEEQNQKNTDAVANRFVATALELEVLKENAASRKTPNKSTATPAVPTLGPTTLQDKGPTPSSFPGTNRQSSAESSNGVSGPTAAANKGLKLPTQCLSSAGSESSVPGPTGLSNQSPMLGSFKGKSGQSSSRGDRSVSSASKGPKPSSFSASNRQTSHSSDTSNKKRKRENGSSGSIRKSKRHLAGNAPDSDDPEDSDFLVQPMISSDDEDEEQ